MSFWWNTIALPIIGFMRHANYPEDAVQSYASLFLTEILPLLGPCKSPVYPSWMTDDHTPVEFSLILGGNTQSSVRFSFEPSAWALARERSMAAIRPALERLASAMRCGPKFNLDWFDICAEELLLAGIEERPGDGIHPVSEIFIGFDCTHYSADMKIYFMPRIRSLVSKESPEVMMKQVTDRLGLGKPWAKISQFLSRFLPGDRPEIEIVAIDCVSASENRLKIYFRTHILSYRHMEYFLTLGGALSDVAAGLHNARLLWDAMTQGTGISGAYFPAGLIYYELRHGGDFPSSKVYLPVRRYLPNDMAISQGIERLACQTSDCAFNSYSNLIQTMFPHRALSARTGIHTYIGCTVKRGGGDISLYYSPEAFAPGRVESLRGPIILPKAALLSSSDTQRLAKLWIHEFDLLVNGDQDAKLCLAADCCLRDLLVFSPTFRMLEGREKTIAHIQSNSLKFSDFALMEAVTFKAVTDQLHLIQGRVRFEDGRASYVAVFTLVSRDDLPWQCWALLTVVDRSKRNDPQHHPPHHIDTLIIGAGQAGLATAAHLRRFGVNVCVIERSTRVGAPWRNRYESLEFNTPKDFSHLPYLPFPEEWPMFPTAAVVANHLEQYPLILGLDVRTATEAVRTNYDEGSKLWTVWLRRAHGSEFTLTSNHLVVATGVDALGGLKPRIPQVPGSADFRGTILHSTAVRNTLDWIGKRVVVFGASCSGHDICKAAWNSGASEVTMVQRSSTAVISREVLLKLFPDLYTGDQRPSIETADQLYLALPTPISKVLRGAMMKKLALVDKDLHLNLQAKGFQLPVGESDFIERLTVRRGGYYINQGCSDLISNGSVQLRPYDSIESIVADGISLVDGHKLEADIIIFATGFETDSKPATFLSDSIYDKTGKIGGMDDEGEAIGLWRPSGHEHLWFAGGDLFNCRFYSRLLALQIFQAE
ncbi:tryptophan dimethylallyltransferase-domain-containing protein [Mycena maculata]|uniref:Tryptophan dimethylallyltransferase-domain-containing protein n=1 Tax=Mycena maculata TaxID=230809 RepID=A0AAD7HY03_9AGAR|nr:tryptophan dimethylallyltransferase-domain-containing protein [Mycena maculata]